MDRTYARAFKKNIKGDLKSKRTKRLDKANPVRALARIVDDEYGASGSGYDEIHVDGKVYSSRDREGTKKYKPLNYQKPRKTELNKIDGN